MPMLHCLIHTLNRLDQTVLLKETPPCLFSSFPKIGHTVDLMHRLKVICITHHVKILFSSFLMNG